MARFFHSLWIRWGFLFIFSSLGMSGPLRGSPCLAPTGLPSEDQWGFFAYYAACIYWPIHLGCNAIL